MNVPTARRRTLSTLHFPRRERWVESVEMLEPSTRGTAAVVSALLRRAPDYEALVLDGASHRDQLVGILLAARRRSPPIIFTDATWGLSGPLVDRLASKLAARLLNRPDCYFCAISSYDRDSLPRVWGFDPDHVFVTLFYATLIDEEMREPELGGVGVFAGGNSLRDYETLLAAARELPAIGFTLATSLITGAALENLPTNVTAAPVPHAEFVAALRRASVVVVPLEPGVERSAGQQTYLNAMVLGKIVIVSDGPGVRDYVTDRETGLVVPPGDPRAMAAALRWATDPDNEVPHRRMRERARSEVLERFTPESYVDSLLVAIESVIGS